MWFLFSNRASQFYQELRMFYKLNKTADLVQYIKTRYFQVHYQNLKIGTSKISISFNLSCMNLIFKNYEKNKNNCRAGYDIYCSLYIQAWLGKCEKAMLATSGKKLE